MSLTFDLQKRRKSIVSTKLLERVKSDQVQTQTINVDSQGLKYTHTQILQQKQFLIDPIVSVVDARVKKMFVELSERLRELQTIKSNTEAQLANRKQLRVVEISTLQAKLDHVEGQIRKFENVLSEKETYLSRSIEIFSQPINTTNQIVNINIDDEGWQDCFETEIEDPRAVVIKEFLTFAQCFVEVPELKSEEVIQNCESCGYIFDERSIKGFGKKCPDCGVEVHSIEFSKSSSGTLVTYGQKSGYQAQATFRKICTHFIGIDEEAPDMFMINKLNDYYVRRGYPDRSYICAMQLNMTPETDDSFVVTRGPTSVQLLIEGLKENGFNQWFKKVNIVGVYLWGWRLPNLTMNDVDAMMPTFMFIYTGQMHLARQGAIQRKNSICHNWVLFAALRIEGYKCPKNQFKLPDAERVLNYEDILRQICSSSGKTFPDLV